MRYRNSYYFGWTFIYLFITLFQNGGFLLKHWLLYYDFVVVLVECRFRNVNIRLFYSCCFYCNNVILPGWSTYYSLTPWMMPSVSSSPSYLQKLGSVTLEQQSRQTCWLNRQKVAHRHSVLQPLSSSGPRLTFCHRTRALLCLFRLADAATLETQFHIPRNKIQ